ncbi:A1pp-domain-containing protein, partial [Tilletiaria anomala UBC 951]
SLSSLLSVADLFASGKLTPTTQKSGYQLRHPDRLYLWEGDITKLAADAIVNAANEGMLGGGGVDGAIHRAAGPKLREACEKHPADASSGARCPTGEARTTQGFNLPAKLVLHTVGPVYSKSKAEQSRELLANAYRNSLAEAEKAGAKSIAFPSISTGVYGYPIRDATEVAIETVDRFLASSDKVQQTCFCVFSSHDKEVYE